MSSTFHRAYSLLTVKAVDAEKRVFSGIATTPEVDRVGDVVETSGLEFQNPTPLILYHDKTKPVGQVVFGKPTKAGLPFTASIPEIVEPGSLRDRVEEAWLSVKYGLIRAVSIGFKPFDDFIELTKTGLRFVKSEVLELSLVVVPANAHATIQTVKALDAEHLPASGDGAGAVPLPGVPASRVVTTQTNKKMTKVKTLDEQMDGYRAELLEKNNRLDGMIAKSGEDGSVFTEEEQQEYDDLEKEAKAIQAHLDRLAAAQERQKSAAVPVVAATAEQASASRSGVTISFKEKLPKGTLFTRYAMAVAAGKGSISDTIAFAKRWDTQTPEVSAYIRKAVEGTSVVTTSPSWGGELVYATNLAAEFIDLLRPATIVGRINGIRMVPFNVRIPVQTGGSTVNWVGEAAPKPVSELDFDTITMGYDKIAGIVVLTEELVRLSSPSAEETVRRDLVEQIARFMDAQFITPSVTASANNPASITNGVSAIAATGTDADALYADLNTALATFDSTDLGTNSLTFVMTPALARGISTLRNALGQFEFAGVNMGGGQLLGFPVLVSNTVPAGTIVIIKADEILMADDGRVTLDASNQATLDMNGGSSPDFNLWQRNCVGIRAERWVTWRKRRADAVSLIDGASYGPSNTSP